MTRMKPEERCSERVSDHTGFHNYQCLRRGKLRHRGKLYCQQHHPPNVAEKRAEKERRWRKESELESLRYVIKDARAAIVERARELIVTKAGESKLRAAVEDLQRLETKLAKVKVQL